jgi:hypothetical protein
VAWPCLDQFHGSGPNGTCSANLDPRPLVTEPDLQSALGQVDPPWKPHHVRECVNAIRDPPSPSELRVDCLDMSLATRSPFQTSRQHRVVPMSYGMAHGMPNATDQRPRAMARHSTDLFIPRCVSLPAYAEPRVTIQISTRRTPKNRTLRFRKTLVEPFSFCYSLCRLNPGGLVFWAPPKMIGAAPCGTLDRLGCRETADA